MMALTCIYENIINNKYDLIIIFCLRNRRQHNTLHLSQNKRIVHTNSRSAAIK